MSIQGSLQALRGFNQFIHFTNWTVAHAHLALLGFVAFTMWATVYYMFPRITGRAAVLRAARLDPLVAHDRRLPRLLLRADSRRPRAGSGTSRRASRSSRSCRGVAALWIGRAACGTVIILAQYLFAYNIFRTLAEQTDARREDRRRRPAADAVATA